MRQKLTTFNYFLFKNSVFYFNLSKSIQQSRHHPSYFLFKWIYWILKQTSKNSTINVSIRIFSVQICNSILAIHKQGICITNKHKKTKDYEYNTYVVKPEKHVFFVNKKIICAFLLHLFFLPIFDPVEGVVKREHKSLELEIHTQENITTWKICIVNFFLFLLLGFLCVVFAYINLLAIANKSLTNINVIYIISIRTNTNHKNAPFWMNKCIKCDSINECSFLWIIKVFNDDLKCIMAQKLTKSFMTHTHYAKSFKMHNNFYMQSWKIQI